MKKRIREVLRIYIGFYSRRGWLYKAALNNGSGKVKAEKTYEECSVQI